MRVVLKGSYDTDTVIKIAQDEANKYLKLRLPKDGVAKVTGEKDDDGNLLLKIPVDTRYKQDPKKVMDFYQAWAKKVYNRTGINEGYMMPLQPM